MQCASFTITVPIRWFAFELCLLEVAKIKNCSFLTKNEVLKVGECLNMDDHNVILALKYFHRVTIILYFPQILPNLVFVDPQPILDILSQIIALTYADDPSIIVREVNPAEIKKLKVFGLFKEELLPNLITKTREGVKYNVFSENFQPANLIKLLMDCNIIAEVNDGLYFLPCALCPHRDSFKPESLNSMLKLFFVWQKKDEIYGTETLPVPQGMFPLIVVHLLKQKQKIFISTRDGAYRFRDALSLEIGTTGTTQTLLVVNRYKHMEFYLTKCETQCPQVRQHIIAAIEDSSNRLGIEHHHKYAFPCPSHKSDCYCIIDNTDNMRDIYYCNKCEPWAQHHINVKNERDYSCWFSDILSAQGKSNFIHCIVTVCLFQIKG